MSNKEDFTELLKKCINHLKSVHEDVKDISGYLEQFSSFLEQVASLQEDQPVETEDTLTPLPTTETTSERKMRFHEVSLFYFVHLK